MKPGFMLMVGFALLAFAAVMAVGVVIWVLVS